MRAMPAAPKIVFFGTPEFAVPTLDALAAAGHEPVVVVTQPTRPAGRGQRPQDSPVARWALARDLPLRRPERVREPGFLDELRAAEPDLAVVVAFGQIFPRELLALPRHGCINLHASLLPRYRGAAPIQAAIAAGDRVTGVTTMLMEAGLDSGPILLQREVEIGAEETAGELAPRLAAAGGALVVETLGPLLGGTLGPRPQDSALATHAPRLTRDDGIVDWSLSAVELWHRLRAYTPWPGLATALLGRPLKLVWARPTPAPNPAAVAEPGTYLGLVDGRAAVACGGGTVLGVETLQRPGKKPQAAALFVNGERLVEGERFG
jgi:methionyl-tRNA formyltransferase